MHIDNIKQLIQTASEITMLTHALKAHNPIQTPRTELSNIVGDLITELGICQGEQKNAEYYQLICTADTPSKVKQAAVKLARASVQCFLDRQALQDSAA